MVPFLEYILFGPIVGVEVREEIMAGKMKQAKRLFDIERVNIFSNY
jgi:hypothetical protein